MSEQRRVTVVERVPHDGGPDTFAYHLLDGAWDESASFQPVRCGGGIISPYRQTVGRSVVCPDCLARTLTSSTTSRRG